MAVLDIGILEHELPQLFDHRSPTENWDDDWLIIPVDEPESLEAIEIEAELVREDSLETVAPREDDQRAEFPSAFGDGGDFPGQPTGGQHGDGFMPPPDAFAFYLPFHYYFPNWWGVYLVAEGVSKLARILKNLSQQQLSPVDAVRVARVFLYGHEQFHHIVESFATRLEISHRVPLYRKGFESFYRRTLGTDQCMEEALANAHGIRRVRNRVFRQDPRMTEIAVDAVMEYVRQCSPGYRLGADLAQLSRFKSARDQFAEDNLQASVWPGAGVDPAVWKCFPHAFSGIAGIKSRVNYIVHRQSPIALRHGLAARYMTYRDLAKKLKKLADCSVVREGKGSHIIWQSSAGARFPVPRHPGDLRKGTLKSILRQAGLAMSVREFMAARA